MDINMEDEKVYFKRGYAKIYRDGKLVAKIPEAEYKASLKLDTDELILDYSVIEKK